jgi:phenylpropionate dioxygenase-like ring-hydroxylating dioxygenase large terminal subunit
MERIKWSNNNFDDNKIFRLENFNFFNPPNFIGTTHLVNENNYSVLSHYSDKYIITKLDNYTLLKNCCLHKNAKLVESTDKVRKNIFICPIHFWTYNFKGELINAPLSNLDCKKSKLNITLSPELFNLNGFLFSNESLFNEIKNSKFLSNIDLTQYSIFKTEKEIYKGNWKEYGIVYNDTNHVRIFHPEMGTILDIDSTELEEGVDYSTHRHRFKPDWRIKPENNFTQFFKLLEKQNINLKDKDKDNYAVTFVTIYPNVFIDFWAGFVWIEIVNPINEGEYEVHAIGLCKNVLIDNIELLDLFSKAYDRVGSEDREILDRIHHGRKNLQNKDNEYTELITNSAENSIISYIEWIHKKGKDFYNGTFQVDTIS